MTRPKGEPGTFTYGCGTFTAVRDYDGGLWWRSSKGHWHQCSSRLAARGAEEDRFTPDPDVPEWAKRCDHDHPQGMTCFTEAQCDALARAEEATWGDR